MKTKDFLDKVREFPVLGGLVDCDGRDHWESLGQTTVLFALSSMPIWLGALVVYATSDNAGHTAFKAALFSTISRGELFMYSTAFLAPIFWIALTDKPNMRVFPGKVSHIVLMVIISSIAAVFYGLLTAGNKLIQPFTFDLSVVMFVTSLILLYLGILYHENRIADAPTIMQNEEQSFASGYSEHRDEQ